MPGPLPNPQRRRRNAPTIPTTDLPARGRTGDTPKPPAWVDLGKAGKAWWRWAWRTPQAAGWSSGDLAMIARRAVLEDFLAAREVGDSVRLAELLDVEWTEALDIVKCTIDKLSQLAGGALQIMKEQRELDDRLGLTPKGLAALRWRIVDEDKKPASTSKAAPPAGPAGPADDRRSRLRVV